MAKSDDLVKFITQRVTERVVTIMEVPREERRQNREDSRKPKEPWSVRWFGMLPFAFHMLFSGRRKAGAKGEPPIKEEKAGKIRRMP